MNGPGKHCGGWPFPAGVARRCVAAVLASALAIGCDHPFQPFQQNEEAVFSMFGYLDLRADTQWVRVMPVRQHLLLDPEPIDAVVTLEHLGSGRVVTLNDSLFRYADRRLDAMAYAYNFWTTEPLEPGASYRLTAVRSDGASTTALVDMPAYPEISFLNDVVLFGGDVAYLRVRAEQVPFVDMIYTMSTTSGERAGSITTRPHWTSSIRDPGVHDIRVQADTMVFEGLGDVHRQEIRLVAARSDWPYHPELTDLEVTLPGTMPSNVVNGVGFVGGLATWTMPFHRCQVLEARADRALTCAHLFHAQSASLAGRVIREPCGEPHTLTDIRLTETFADGGAVVRTWKTGWDGEYRFEGIEPGADLVLELNPAAPAVHVPALAPGERHVVKDISVSVGC